MTEPPCREISAKVLLCLKAIVPDMRARHLQPLPLSLSVLSVLVTNMAKHIEAATMSH